MTVARTVSARGQLARQVAGADAVEIKATIAPRQIARALDYFGVSRASAEQRFVYFFDTPRLELFRSGLIVRARRIPGRAHDCTIKVRPVRTEDVPVKWHKDRGFKIEADATGTAIVRSASLTRDVPKGAIKRFEDGKEPLKSLFDKRQELFAGEFSRKGCDFSKLVQLGPLAALWWKIESPGLPWPFVAELWERPDGAKVLEASVRVPVAQTAVAGAGFLAFLTELGAVRSIEQQAKTRWALDYFSRRLAKSQASKKPSGKRQAGVRRKHSSNAA